MLSRIPFHVLYGRSRRIRIQWTPYASGRPTIPDYVPSPEEPKQASLSPNYVPGPKYPKYLALSDEEVLVEDQPYAAADSPIALSLGYIADLDPEDELEDGPTDYLADKGDDDHDSSGDDTDDEEEKEASEDDEDEEEH
uniref:Uncharacterized protein n=1 Tax=Tanacetum cinerariifolium TaxID=118510 RepID=A0A699HJM4_TANCI|nr:hypothetical protein [Tanacetum cinerariifolium]